MATQLWTHEQIKLAFHLYCQLPYGRIHGRNPEIMALAKVIGRTADAVAMKMLNIASIDPAMTSTGRVGLGNASALDFRRAVLSSYRGRCCMSGLSDARLLIASHIVPWSQDKANRLNPSNGLCLSALHDRAFDKGLITLADDLTVILSHPVKQSDDAFVKAVLLPLSGQKIEPPERFSPLPAFIAWHRNSIFVDSQSKVGPPQ